DAVVDEHVKPDLVFTMGASAKPLDRNGAIVRIADLRVAPNKGASEMIDVRPEIAVLELNVNESRFVASRALKWNSLNCAVKSHCCCLPLVALKRKSEEFKNSD